MRQHDYFMGRALAEAAKGLGKTSPNPAVGAVVVRNGRIIATGFHRKAGLPHAEIEAFSRVDASRLRGASLYVTLEPCATFGRTPPCTDAIIRAGIRRVYIGTRDPNPVNGGKGIRRLRRHGITVVSGVREEEARRLNEPFNHYIVHRTPFITVKVAQSLDGKIATRTGDSRWITSAATRRYVHRLRAAHEAILVGVGTVDRDDPLLTVRYGSARARTRQPVRIVLDPHFRVPADARLFTARSPAPVIVVTSRAAYRRASARRRAPFAASRARQLLFVRLRKGQFVLKDLVRALGERGIMSVLVEGGGRTVASFVEQGIAHKYLFCIAPLIIGGESALTAVEGRGIARLAQARHLVRTSLRRIGTDVIVEGYTG